MRTRTDRHHAVRSAVESATVAGCRRSWMTGLSLDDAVRAELLRLRDVRVVGGLDGFAAFDGGCLEGVSRSLGAGGFRDTMPLVFVVLRALRGGVVEADAFGLEGFRRGLGARGGCHPQHEYQNEALQGGPAFEVRGGAVVRYRCGLRRRFLSVGGRVRRGRLNRCTRSGVAQLYLKQQHRAVPRPQKKAPKHPALRKLGARVRQLREQRSVSQEQLALTARVGRSYMSGVQRGVRNPSFLQLLKLARALRVRVGDFFPTQSRPISKMGAMDGRHPVVDEKQQLACQHSSGSDSGGDSAC